MIIFGDNDDGDRWWRFAVSECFNFPVEQIYG